MTNNKKRNIIIQAVIFLAFVAIIFINRFPAGSFVAAGDFYQLINPVENFGRYFYMWFNQVGPGMPNTLAVTYPFYSIIGLLGYLNISSGAIASILMLIILYFSYLSFYLSIKYLFPNLSTGLKIGGALVYALNNFTLTIFTYPWGFTHHFLFYVFAPPLLFLFLRIYLDKKINLKLIVLFVITFIASIIAYTNLNFLVILTYLFIIFLVVLLVLRRVKFDKRLIAKSIILFIICLIISAWFVAPFFIEHRGLNVTYSNKTLGADYFEGWLDATSSNFLHSLMLTMDKHRYPIIGHWIFSLLSIGYIVVVLILSLLNSRKKDKDFGLICSLWLVFIVIVFLSVRAYGPFYEIAHRIYKTIVLFPFRSPDKIFLVLPVIYCSILMGLLYRVKLSKKIVVLIFVVLLAAPPFYLNTISKTLSGIEQGHKYHKVVKIPQEYYDISKIVNGDNVSASIISVPYSVVNSINWSNYPKWYYMGHDVLHLLFNKFYISANNFDHVMLETKLSFKEFNKNKGTPEELLELIGKYSGQYILFHKDIVPAWQKASKHLGGQLIKLEEEKEIRLIEENDYFKFYEVVKENLVPFISGRADMNYRKINPTKYVVNINLKEKTELVFNQAFSSNWKLFLRPRSQEECEVIADLNYRDPRLSQIKKELADLQPPVEQKYITQDDETYRTIAEQYGADLDVLLEANDLFSWSYAVPGEELVIPVSSEAMELYERKKDGLAMTIDFYPEVNNSECRSERKFTEGEELKYLFVAPLFDNTHKMVNDYANAWTADPEFIKNNYSSNYYKVNDDGSVDVELVIYFQMQSYLYAGMIITIIFLVGSIVILVLIFRKNNKTKNHEKEDN